LTHNERKEAISYLVTIVGWQVVEVYIEARIADHIGQLMTCSIEDVPKHRAKVEALKGIGVFVAECLSEE